MTLMTREQALGVACRHDKTLPSALWDRLVDEKLAPQPVARRGALLWDGAQVTAWVRDELDRALDTIMRRSAGGRRSSSGGATSGQQATSAPAVVVLLDSHRVRLDPEVPLHVAMVQAETPLQDIATALAGRLNKAETNLAAEQDYLTQLQSSPPGPETGRGPARWLARRRWAEAVRRQDLEVEGIRAHADLVRQRMSDAWYDLGRVREWIEDMLIWADDQRRRREEADRAAAAQAEHAARSVSTAPGRVMYPTSEIFVRENRARLSYTDRSVGAAAARHQSTADVGAAGGAEAQPLTLFLAGGDFGYRWRLDGHNDGDHWHQPEDQAGQWRVGWIEATRELYAEHHTGDSAVLLIGQTPEYVELPIPDLDDELAGMPWEVSFYDVVDWISPLEARQDERNSLAMLCQAFDEQRAAGFPSLRRP